jgi:imidazoleglycerol-phosphate dehydratase/histidinol-phosphatase
MVMIYNISLIYIYLKYGLRKSIYIRTTKETNININLNIDGIGKYKIFTGLFVLDHMIEQLASHALVDIIINVKGDLNIDEHHTIEDTGIALGYVFRLALVDKRSISRYGFCLPMDDSVAQLYIDVGGRCQLVWKVKFTINKIGNVTNEMFSHLFKSFSESAKCNINIWAQGDNEHHKIESIFKNFSRAIKMSITRNFNTNRIPTTKGLL